MPIRRRGELDVVNPPGCVRFEQPLGKLIEEYETESRQETLRDVFQRGYRDGYQAGFKDASDGYSSFFHLDPSSEAAR